MSVWFAIPSARPVDEAAGCLMKWHKRGYKIAVWRDTEDDGIVKAMQQARMGGAIVLNGEYRGYAKTVNKLVEEILELDPRTEWICVAGDDTSCDPNFTAAEIGFQLTCHFRGTFGVMQATGDRFAGGSIDNIAGSPFLGREWCERAHQGSGPLCHMFSHMAVDEALKYSAEREGVYLMRPDLSHHHAHFTRIPGTDEVNWQRGIPPHLAWCNQPEHWAESRKLMEEFKRDYMVRWKPLDKHNA